MHEIDDTQPDPCPDCGARVFVRVWRVDLGDQHDEDHDNKHIETAVYRCDECGAEQKVRSLP